MKLSTLTEQMINYFSRKNKQLTNPFIVLRTINGAAVCVFVRHIVAVEQAEIDPESETQQVRFLTTQGVYVTRMTLGELQALLDSLS